jgi:hypothetical protein
VIVNNWPAIVVCLVALVAIYAAACIYFGNDM